MSPVFARLDRLKYRFGGKNFVLPASKTLGGLCPLVILVLIAHWEGRQGVSEFVARNGQEIIMCYVIGVDQN